MSEFETKARAIHQRQRQHVDRTDSQIEQSRKASLELFEAHAESHRTGVAQLLDRGGKVSRKRQHETHLLLANSLSHNQVVFERVEIAQEEITGEQFTEIA